MSKSLHSSVTGISAKQSSIGDATKRKTSGRKLKKSSLMLGLGDGFKDAFYLTCHEMEMKNIPNVKILASEPQSWTNQLENMADKDFRSVGTNLTKLRLITCHMACLLLQVTKTISAPVKKVLKQGSDMSVADPDIIHMEDYDIVTVYGVSPRSALVMIICKHFRMTDHILGAFQRTLTKFPTLKTLRYIGNHFTDFILLSFSIKQLIYIILNSFYAKQIVYL